MFITYQRKTLINILILKIEKINRVNDESLKQNLRSCSEFFIVFIVDYQRAIYFDITFSELKDGRLKAVVCADEVFLV